MTRCPSCQTPNDAGARFCAGCGSPLQAQPPAAAAVKTWIVGSGHECDIKIDVPSVSRKHLEVVQAGPGRYIVRDLGSTNGTFLMGQRIHEAEVSASDVLQLGRHPLMMARVEASQNHFASGLGRGLILGRTPPADIVLPYTMISARHLELSGDSSGFKIKDLGSTNGTTINGVRVGSAWTPLRSDDTLALGSFQVPRRQVEQWFARLQEASSGGGASRVVIPNDGRLLLGRDPACDVQLDAAGVSWRHAEIVSRGGQWTVRDLGSMNGVFVNGRRVQTASFGRSDALSLGSLRIDIAGGQIVPGHLNEEGVRLDAVGVSRVVPTDKGPLTILDDVSVSIYPGEMVALMGPSGAGKSTLLEVLTGQRSPQAGRVLFNGQCLHTHFSSLKDHIGYVPQDDIMHRDLTVFEVLFHAARSWDSRRPHHAIEQDVYKVLASMGLSHIAGSLVGGTATIRGISGGQRKRVNIAIELLKSPKLLFLDEPTSGLDARATMEVIRLLKELAANGTTIVMTIHQPRIEAFELMSHLLLLTKGGKLAYFGHAAPGAASYFERRSSLPRNKAGNPADYVIDALDPEREEDKRETSAWQRDYLQSQEHKTFVTDRQRSSESTQPSVMEGAGRRGVSVIDAYLSLTKRYARRKFRDTTALLVQLSQAPIVAVLLGWLFYDSTLDVTVTPTGHVPGSGGAHQTLFLLSASAFWFGCSNVAREIVAERSVFRRERRAGLKIRTYVASMFTVQMAISIVQISTLALLTWPLVGLGAQSFILGLPMLIMTAASGICLGFLVSAIASTEVMALSVIPVILIPQLMFSGYLKLYSVMSDSALQAFVAALTPMRWCFQAMLFFEFEFHESFEDGELIEKVYGFEPWGETWMAEFLGDGLTLALFCALFGFMTAAQLSRTGTSS